MSHNYGYPPPEKEYQNYGKGKAYGTDDLGQYGGHQHEKAPSNSPIVEDSSRKYRDVFWLWVFVLHVVSIVVLFVVGVVVKVKGTASDDSKDNVIIHDDISGTEALHIGFSVAVGTGVAVVFSMVWMVLMKQFPKQMIYITWILNACIYFALAIWMLILQIYLATVVFVIVGVLQIVFLFLWRKSINFAKVMLKTVVQVLREHPTAVVPSYLSYIVLIGWTIFWSVTAALMQQFSPTVSYILLVYCIFSFYWVSQVIKNVVHVTVSGLYATHYFLKGSVHGMPPNPTLDSFKRASTTSLGSICLGSLLVALLQTARALISSFKNNHRDSAAAQIIACLADCILGIIERLVRYFNHYAFTYVAIYGKTYCQAAKATYNLIFTHGFEAVINDNLIGTVVFFGAFVAGAAACLAGALTALVLVKKYIVIVAILSFFVGYVVMALAGEALISGTATYFVCFAQEPQIMQQNNPKLYSKIRSTYNLSFV